MRKSPETLDREHSVKLFAEGKVSISEGAQLADLSVGEYMDLLANRGIKSKVTMEDHKQGLKTAEAWFK